MTPITLLMGVLIVLFKRATQLWSLQPMSVRVRDQRVVERDLFPAVVTEQFDLGGRKTLLGDVLDQTAKRVGEVVIIDGLSALTSQNIDPAFIGIREGSVAF